MISPVSINNIKSLFKNSSSLQKIRNSLGLGNTLSSLPIANGGTGAATKDSAWTALGGGDVGKVNLMTDNSKDYFLRADGEWKVPGVTLSHTNNGSSSRPIFFKNNGELTETEVTNLYFDEEFTFNPSTNKLNVGGGISNTMSTTVLYSGDGTDSSFKLSQDPTNFDVLKVLYSLSTTKDDVKYYRIIVDYLSPTGTAYNLGYPLYNGLRKYYLTRNGNTITLKEVVEYTKKITNNSFTSTSTVVTNQNLGMRYILGHKFN